MSQNKKRKFFRQATRTSRSRDLEARLQPLPPMPENNSQQDRSDGGKYCTGRSIRKADAGRKTREGREQFTESFRKRFNQ